jgi:hypothetical protein
MPNYTLTLTLATPAAPRHSRRALAIAAANENNVTGWNGRPIKSADITDNNGTVTWRVMGTSAEVCAMITEWKRHPNVVTVTSNPTFKCPALEQKS